MCPSAGKIYSFNEGNYNVSAPVLLLLRRLLLLLLLAACCVCFSAAAAQCAGLPRGPGCCWLLGGGAAAVKRQLEHARLLCQPTAVAHAPHTIRPTHSNAAAELDQGAAGVH